MQRDQRQHLSSRYQVCQNAHWQLSNLVLQREELVIMCQIRVFDVSSELSLSQESVLCSQCVLMSMSVRDDTLTVRRSAGEPLIGPLCNLQDTLMTERGGAGWVQPAPAY